MAEKLVTTPTQTPNDEDAVKYIFQIEHVFCTSVRLYSFKILTQSDWDDMESQVCSFVGIGI
jgi:hypothetical protein